MDSNRPFRLLDVSQWGEHVPSRKGSGHCRRGWERGFLRGRFLQLQGGFPSFLLVHGGHLTAENAACRREASKTEETVIAKRRSEFACP